MVLPRINGAITLDGFSQEPAWQTVDPLKVTMFQPTLNWAQTASTENDSQVAGPASSRLRVNWERRSEEGISYDLGLSRQGKDYNPGMGFVSRTDYTLFRNEVSYGWFPGEDSPISLTPSPSSSWWFFRNADGSLESAEVGPLWSRTTKSGVFTSLGVEVLHESITDTFHLSDDSRVPPDAYTFAELNASYQSPSGDCSGWRPTSMRVRFMTVTDSIPGKGPTCTSFTMKE